MTSKIFQDTERGSRPMPLLCTVVPLFTILPFAVGILLAVKSKGGPWMQGLVEKHRDTADLFSATALEIFKRNRQALRGVIWQFYFY